MKPLHRIMSTAVIVTVVAVAQRAMAHPGHSHHHDSDSEKHSEKKDNTRSPNDRTWTVERQRRSLSAALLIERDGQVKLEERNGSVVTIPLSDLAVFDRLWIEQRELEIHRLNTEPIVRLVALQTEGRRKTEIPRPSIAKYFDPFKKHVDLRWDDRYLYVESNGIPDHTMMVGITAWQQQVPLPQPYTGNNTWQIPLHPVPARRPMSAKTNFFRGAIALAVNGVPIFNPIKNDGRTDTLLAGELDEFGGHCGRADDYHYHIAPVHLDKVVGKGNPIAFALDGYPIYGYEDADDSKPHGLDWLNGHKDADGKYHYHATKTYPYLNGGFYGEVVERGGQADSQARAQGVRPYTRPLRGAKVTKFSSPKPGTYSLGYEIRGEKRNVNYAIADDGTVTFKFVDPSGTRTETYRPRTRGRDQGGRRRGGRPRRRPG